MIIHMRQIINMAWIDTITNLEILRLASLQSVKDSLIQKNLR